MPWYVVRTVAKQEKKVSARLLEANYYAYCPLVPGDRRQGKFNLEPAFTGYVFVALTEGEDDFHPIKYTPGVLNLISFSRDKHGCLRPTPIPDEIIEGIMASENNGFETKSAYSKGDKVRFTSGPLADYEAEIAEIMQKGGEERAALLLRHLEKMIRIEAKTKDIQPVN